MGLWIFTVTNSSPIANDDAATIDQNEILNGTNLLANDSDIEGDPLSINTVPVVDVSNGVLTINPDGTYTYTPNADYFGQDQLSYSIVDDEGRAQYRWGKNSPTGVAS